MGSAEPLSDRHGNVDRIGNLHNDQYARTVTNVDRVGDANQHPDIHPVRLGSADGNPNAISEHDGLCHPKPITHH